MPSPFESSAGVSAPSGRRLRRWVFIALTPIAVFATLALISFVLRFGWSVREESGRRAMQVELEKLSSDGIPIDNQGISEGYNSQTSDEFYDQWEELIAAIHSEDFKSSYAGVPAFDPTVEVEEFADEFEISEDWVHAKSCLKFISQNKQLVVKARELALKPEPIRFPIVFQSTETLLPDVQAAREVARLLSTDAQVATLLGDHDRLAVDTLALFELSKHVEAVPSVVARLAAIAIRRQAFYVLQHAIHSDLLSDSQLLRVNALLADRIDINHRWSRLIQDEMSFMLPVFLDPNLALQTDNPIPARGHDAVYFINLMRRAIELNTDDWTRFYSAAQQLGDQLDDDMDEVTEAVDRMLSGLLAPAFEALAAVLINDAQLHKQARIAIYLRLYQHQSNQFPSSLDELPDEIAALKPYGVKPFGYQLDKTQAIIWGFYLSDECLQTPDSIPSTTENTAASATNRLVVWRIKKDATAISINTKDSPQRSEVKLDPMKNPLR